MTPRDFSELKRRLNPDHRNPTLIRGCYIDHTGQIITEFRTDLHSLTDTENQKYMAIFRKALSGTIGQCLLPVEFTPRQTMEDENYALLAKLRATALKDDETVHAAYEKVISGLVAENADLQSVSDAQNAANWLILFMHDGYDMPHKDNNGENDYERGTDVFSYIVCAVCPVRQAKPALSYVESRTRFCDRSQDWIAGNPDFGFLFPAFEERAADVYQSVFYTRDSGDPHEALLKAIFNTEPYMPAKEQKEAFSAVLATSLADECSMEVIQAVHETVAGMIEKQKEDKQAAPLTLTRDDLSNVLTECGVSDEKTTAFEQEFDEVFGTQTALPAVNVVTPKQFKVETPSVSIRVDPAHSDLVETRMIDGRCYIMVLADGDVEVNGMIVKVKE